MIVWVAYSGGVDSHVLLHALAQLRKHCAFELRAVHIHHGLSPNAEAWQKHCVAVCQALDIELTTHALNMSSPLTQHLMESGNIEARARTLRYQFFSSLLQPNDCLLTGHHQDDQAETLLLQLLRGAGPKGMSAMPASSLLGKGVLLRPFLATTRAELLAYAQQHALSWIDDESNQDRRYSRNFIRQEIMPLLQQRWPSVVETIARSAKHCAETEELVEAYIEPLFNACVSPDYSLSITSLKNLTPLQQKHVLRYWISCCGFSLPNELMLANALHIFLTAGEDKTPMVTWGDVVLRRYQDALIVLPVARRHDASQQFCWDMNAELSIESLNITLRAVSTLGSGVKWLPHQSCEIRFRCGDERVYLARRKGGRSLKKCFQEWRVPVWERDRIPLLYIDNKLAAIIGYSICEGFLVDKNENGRVIEVL